MSKGFLLAFAAAIAWAVAIIITRILLREGGNVYNLSFWTTLLELPFFLFLFLKHRHEFIKTPKNHKLILLAMGIISGVGIGLTEYFALKFSPAVNYSFLIRTVTLFTVVFAYFFLGEKLTKAKVLLVGVIIVGSYFLTTNGQHLAFSKGDFFTLLEAMLLAIGNNVLGKAATQRMSSNLSASAAFLIAVLPLFVIAAINNGIYVPDNLLLIILLAITFLILAMLRFYAYRYLSASAVTMVYSFTPVFVSIMAIFLLGESLSVLQFVGGFLIVAAGALVTKLRI
ncbi:MAG TPA: DMT family transporter [Candidatus Eisenbacteria bacterium]|nr:DMT family transporter [Candidatus Eisenbacteria bacterium]